MGEGAFGAEWSRASPVRRASGFFPSLIFTPLAFPLVSWHSLSISLPVPPPTLSSAPFPCFPDLSRALPFLAVAAMVEELGSARPAKGKSGSGQMISLFLREGSSEANDHLSALSRGCLLSCLPAWRVDCCLARSLWLTDLLARRLAGWQAGWLSDC